MRFPRNTSDVGEEKKSFFSKSFGKKTFFSFLPKQIEKKSFFDKALRKKGLDRIFIFSLPTKNSNKFRITAKLKI